MLNLRTLGRQEPDAPATGVLTETQINVLRAIVKRQKKHTLPRRPTVQEAMLAIALLGGYVKSRRPPGWLILGRGLHDLLIAEMGWVACAEARKA